MHAGIFRLSPLLFVFLVATPACTTSPGIATVVSSSPTTQSPAVVSPLVLGADDEEGHSFLVGALLYVPNRILDAFDLFRFGVDVGPGVGLEAQATEFAQATLVSRLSAGVGYQTLRHLPAQLSSETGLAVGPLDADARVGIPWYRSNTDFRLGFHVLLIGAHVAIDPVEWADFPLGFFGVDLKEDDY